MSGRQILEAEVLRYERLGKQAQAQGNSDFAKHCEREATELKQDIQTFPAKA